jgi:hypothetical protein
VFVGESMWYISHDVHKCIEPLQVKHGYSQISCVIFGFLESPSESSFAFVEFDNKGSS